MRVVIPYKPRKQFLPYHKRTERFSCILAHRRAGKTVCTINELIKSALTCPLKNPRVAYIAPELKQAKSTAWTYAKEFGLKIPGAKPHESELRIDFPNGGQLRLFGSDNVDALRGIYLDDVVLDEYADIDPRLFPLIIRPALSDRKGKATFIGTPKGRNNALYNVCEKAKIHKDWHFSLLRVSETKIVDESELASVRDDMTEEQYLQEYECSFEAAIVGAYYGKDIHQAEKDGRVAKYPYNPAFPVSTAWDIGFTDDTAIWFYQAYNNKVYIIDYYFQNNEGPDHYSDILLGKGYNYKEHWLPIDAKHKNMSAYGRSTFDQLAVKLGWDKMRVNKKDTLQNGINAVRLMLPKVHFNKELCEDGINALAQYRRVWDDNNKCCRDKPKHDWTSHPADAFRYLAISYQNEVNATKQPPKQKDDYSWDDEEEGENWKTV